MTVIGFRIDFYDNPGFSPEEKSTGYLGSVVKERSYRVQAVPQAGELIGLARMAVGRKGVDHVPLQGNNLVPFLPVRAVEHYPQPVAGEGDPAVIVVLHAPLVYNGTRLAHFVATYINDGWGWMLADHEELKQAYAQATAADGLAPAGVTQ